MNLVTPSCFVTPTWTRKHIKVTMNTVIFDVFVADRLEVTYLEPELMGCFVDSCDLSFFFAENNKTTNN